MKRFYQGLLLGAALAVLPVLTGIPGLLPNVLARLDGAALAEWRVARLSFYTDIAFLSCASPADVRRAAEARGWDVEIVIPETDAAMSALRIHTRPGRPGAQDAAGEIERFDDRGCLMR